MAKKGNKKKCENRPVHKSVHNFHVHNKRFGPVSIYDEFIVNNKENE